MRYLLLAACLVTTLLALMSWGGSRGRTTQETVTRESHSIQRSGSGPGKRSTLHRTVVEPTSSLRSEALTITLATLAATLLLAVAFWDRLLSAGRPLRSPKP